MVSFLGPKASITDTNTTDVSREIFIFPNI